MAAEPVVFYPSEEELLRASQRDIACTEAGCQRRFSTLPALWMHSAKTHRVYKDDWHKDAFFNNQVKRRGVSVKKQFACPVLDCSRGKPFDRMEALKAHYINMHAEKKFPCEKCGRKFPTVKSLEVHTKRCGQLLKCSCGTPYTTPEALYMHAKRHNHELTEEFKNSRQYFWRRKDLQAEAQGLPPPENHQASQTSTSSQPSKNHRRPEAPILPKGRPVFILHQIVKLTTMTEKQPEVMKRNQQPKLQHSSSKRKKSAKQNVSTKGASSKRKKSGNMVSPGEKHIPTVDLSNQHARNEGGIQAQANNIPESSSANKPHQSIPAQSIPLSRRPNPSVLTNTQVSTSVPLIQNTGSDMYSTSGQSSARNFLASKSSSNTSTTMSNHLLRVPVISSLNRFTGMHSLADRSCNGTSLTGQNSFSTVDTNLGLPDTIPDSNRTDNRLTSVVPISAQSTSGVGGSCGGHTSAVATPAGLLGEDMSSKPSSAGSIPSVVTSIGNLPILPASSNPNVTNRNVTNSPGTRILQDLQMLEPSNSGNRDSSLQSLPEPSTDSNDSISFRSIGTSLETLCIPTQTDFDILDLLESCDIHTQTIESIFANSPVLMETSATQTQERRNTATNLPLANEAQTLVDNVLELSTNQASMQTQTQQTECSTMETQTLRTSQELDVRTIESMVGNIFELGTTSQASMQTQTHQAEQSTMETQTQGASQGEVVELQTMTHSTIATATCPVAPIPLQQESQETQTQGLSQGMDTETVELQTMTHSTIATATCPDPPTPLQQESQETQTMCTLSSHDLLSLDIYTQTGFSDLADHPSLDDLEFSDIQTQTMNDFDLGVFGIDGNWTSTSVQTDLELLRGDTGVNVGTQGVFGPDLSSALVQTDLQGSNSITVGTQVQGHFGAKTMVSTNVQTNEPSSGLHVISQ